MRAATNSGHRAFLPRAIVLCGVFALCATASHDAVAGANACVGPSANSVTINALAESVTYFSIPFTRAPAFCGTVGAIAGNTITVGGPPPGLPGLTPGPDSYYVVITSGVKEGAIYTTNAAVAMTAATVTVNPTPDSCEDLVGVVVGDLIAIIPYWTLTTVWPGAPPANITAGNAAAASTDILLFDSVNQAFDIFWYKNEGIGGVGWRKTTSATVNYANQSIRPNQTIIFLEHASGANQTFLLPPGGGVAGFEVKYRARACLIAPPAGAIPDYNFVSNYHYYPAGAGQTLDQSTLKDSITHCALTGLGIALGFDKLLVYDNAVAAPHKTPLHNYVYFDAYTDGGGTFHPAHWADLMSANYFTDRGADKVFEAGTGVVIERPTSVSSPLIWDDPL